MWLVYVFTHSHSFRRCLYCSCCIRATNECNGHISWILSIYRTQNSLLVFCVFFFVLSSTWLLLIYRRSCRYVECAHVKMFMKIIQIIGRNSFSWSFFSVVHTNSHTAGELICRTVSREKKKEINANTEYHCEFVREIDIEKKKHARNEWDWP